MAEAETKEGRDRSSSAYVNAGLESKIDKLTSLVEAFDARLTAIETQNNPSDSATLAGTDRANTAIASHSPTLDSDIQRDYERLRDAFANIPVPPGLKVNDSSTGIKNESKPSLKILSKCARFAETGMKVIS